MNRRRFLQTTLAAGAVASATPLTALSSPAQATSRTILQAKGLGLVDGSKSVRLRGLNLGGWMLIEDYMIGLPWTEWKIRERFKKVVGDGAYNAFFDAYAQSYIDEADIAFIANQGFNVVRIPFNYRHFEDDLAPGQWIESGFRQLARVVDLCRKYHVWVILDLHAAPGAQARDQNAGSAYGETYFWDYRSFLDRTIALWTELARRYRGDFTIAGYNVLGEPVTANVPLLNEFYTNVIQAIRRVDPDHLILLDPNLWAKDIASLHDSCFTDPQVIPAIHPYYQGNPTFDGLAAYPSVVDGKTFDRKALEKTLDGSYDQQRIPRHVMASEFGIWRRRPQPLPTQLAITKDLISIFEERGWSWSIWCYKDLRDMGLLNVRADTPWRRFLDQPALKDFFRTYKELEAPFVTGVGKLMATTDIDRDTQEQWAREISRDFDVPALDFVLRRLATHSNAELAEMARSFSFAACEVHQDQLQVLKSFL
jgi:endoglucanase